MSTEYLDLTQYELSTPVNYTQLYNNDMLKIDTNAKKTANNITSLSTDVDELKSKSDDMFEDIINLDNSIHGVKDDIADLRELTGNIGDRVDMIHPRTERLFFYSMDKNVATSDTLFYNFDTVQLPAFIDVNPNSGYKIHYRFTSYTRDGIGILAEFTQPISSAISVAVNNASVTSYTMYTISGKTYAALYIYIVKALNISIDNNNVLHANIDLVSEGHNITFSSTGVSDEKNNSHQAGKIIFSFEIFK